jgi:hypothetical protein
MSTGNIKNVAAKLRDEINRGDIEEITGTRRLTDIITMQKVGLK